MRKVLKLFGFALAITLAAAVIAGIVFQDRLTRLMAVNTLFAEDKIVSNFSSMDDLFFHAHLSRGDRPVSSLPAGTPVTLPDGYDTWLTDRAVTAVVMLKDGKVVHEAYHLGTEATDTRISWSVAKSYLSTLFGIAMEKGEISSLDDPVTQYSPALAGTAYDGATIRNVLNMASGVVFDEDYLDFWSDINKMGRVLALGGSMDRFAAGLDDTFAPAGETWKYTSIDTHVLGMVLRGATGRSVPDLLQERVIAPLGLEAAGSYLTDGNGVAFVLGGLNFTTRDYARFGQMVLQGGAWQGTQIVSGDWLTEATRASAPTQPGGERYGYQWWIAPDEDITDPEHAFYGRGVYGQYLYIDPKRDVVIAVNGADRKFREPGVNDSNIAMFRSMAAATDGT
ncbi:serine hydrolase domain-containing protein [Shimia ponticola]|uniref:serine hydrolase domain-containing protein n=1 Tax=Shimia ponticola TaxID=2582893 RepID=UPI0011BEE8E5|nr:serine hydrolase [Shimia ponticola]